MEAIPPIKWTMSSVPELPMTTLLYLEGEPHLAEGLEPGLQAYGYRLVRAKNCKSAVDLLQRHSIDAILADLDGSEAPELRLEALKGLRPVSIPLVALSESGDIELRLAAIRAGCDTLLAKPIDIHDLAEQLDQLCNPVQPEAYRVLIVEDSRTQAGYLRRLLEGAGMVTEVVLEPLKTLEVLATFKPDLILMDMYMPGCDGPELAALIRLGRAYLDIPIVFLSTETDTGKQLEALKHGADDFLTKTIRPEHLISSVRIRAERTRLLRGLMRQDSLTGLLNHSTLKGRLEEEVVRVQRQQGHLCFAMVDIDHFKQVNDTHGHSIGDRVIQALAHLLNRRLRRTDIVGRYGGEEFGIILPDTPLMAAGIVLEDLRKSFGEILHHTTGGTFKVTLSCGVAAWEVGMDTAALNELADSRMYVAKRAGRDRVISG